MAGNVLIMPSSIFPVHRFTMKHLAEELIKRGHSVTWFEYGLKKSEIILPSKVDEIYLTVTPKNLEIYDLYLYGNHSIYDRLWTDKTFWYNGERVAAWYAGIEMCDALLSTTTYKSKFLDLGRKRFDVVIIDDQFNPCGLLHAGLTKTPFIYWSLTNMRAESAWANHSPHPPSFVPVSTTGYTDQMNILERTHNLAIYLQHLYIHQHIILSKIDQLFKKHFPSQKITESFYIERNASLNFINVPTNFDFSRSFMPRVNFVGGLHCKKPKTLPTPFLKFLIDANEKDGFIVISSGFSNQWKHAPKQIIFLILELAKKRSNIYFIWQYNGPKEYLPKNSIKNLYIAPWLPLQDLLGHSKCKAHISHGGLNSLIESVWHGVPVIGWPLTSTNYDNLMRLIDRGSGIMLYNKIPKLVELVSIVDQIYINAYQEEIKIFQDMVIDVPYTELNNSVFWVEFIIRHQEVPHSRSGADELNIFQYFLLDIILFITVCTSGTIYLFFFILKVCCINPIREFLFVPIHYKKNDDYHVDYQKIYLPRKGSEYFQQKIEGLKTRSKNLFNKGKTNQIYTKKQYTYEVENLSEFAKKNFSLISALPSKRKFKKF